MSSNPITSKRWALVLLLAGLSAFGPLSVDMYLPSMPTIARAFASNAATVQYTMVSFMTGYAFGQLSWGPITDRFGRKPPLYVSLSFYILFCAGCASSTGVGMLIALRALQAICACAGGVVARAIVRDLFSGVEAARVYTLQMLAVAMTPMVAPVLGGYLLLFFGWRSIFWTQAIVACVVFVSMHLVLRETHKPGTSATLHLARTLRGYVALLFDRHFAGYALGNGFGAGALFTYIATSSHVYIDVYGMKPEMFGWLFGFASLGVMAASQIASYLHHRFGVAQVLRASFLIKTLLALLVLVLWLVDGGLWAFAIPMFFYLSLIGAIIPSTAALAMESQGHRAGMASALLGTMQFVFGALGAALVGLFAQRSALPLILVILAFSATALAINLAATEAPVRRP
jgi:DHA1 family bicyclomycin/chloramphenicol resistance-like MFS transporter